MAKRPTTEAKLDNLSNETIQKHIRFCSDAKSQLEEASGIYRAALKAAKAAGCNQKQLVAVLNDRKKDADQLVIEMRDYVRYAGLVGIAIKQGDLFPVDSYKVAEAAAQEMEEWQIEEAGCAAGKGGAERGDNKYPPGSPSFAAWDRGYLRGQKMIAAAMGKGGKVASTRKGPRKPRETSPAHLV